MTDPPSARLEPAQLIRPGREATSREQAAYGGGRYLGVLAMVLAVVGMIRRPRQALPWLVVGAVGVVLATGTFLTVDGEVVRWGTGRVRMPLLWLNRGLGYLAEPLNFPARALAMTSTAVAALSALAVADLRKARWLPVLAPLAVVEVVALGMLGWPWASFEPRPTTGLDVMEDAGEGAMLDLALAVRSDHENRWSALATQIAHGKPLNSVPVERIEYFANDGALFFKATALYDDLAPLYQNTDGALDGDYRADLAVLRDAGFRWLIVTYRSGSELIPPRFTTAADALFGPPLARGPGIGVWALPDVEYTADDLAGWKQQHDARMAEIGRMTPGMGRPLR